MPPLAEPRRISGSDRLSYEIHESSAVREGKGHAQGSCPERPAQPYPESVDISVGAGRRRGDQPQVPIPVQQKGNCGEPPRSCRARAHLPPLRSERHRVKVPASIKTKRRPTPSCTRVTPPRHRRRRAREGDETEHDQRRTQQTECRQMHARNDRRAGERPRSRSAQSTIGQDDDEPPPGGRGVAATDERPHPRARREAAERGSTAATRSRPPPGGPMATGDCATPPARRSGRKQLPTATSESAGRTAPKKTDGASATPIAARRGGERDDQPSSRRIASHVSSRLGRNPRTGAAMTRGSKAASS